MKTIIYTLLLLCLFPWGLPAQNGKTTKTTQEILMSKRWYPDFYEEDDKETSFRTYTQTQCIDSVATEEGKLEIYIDNYYLSDLPDKVFNTDKVGKATTGKYIILTGYEELGISAFVLELIEVSEEKIVVRHLTPGMSVYGHINTFYAIPPKRG